MGGFRRQKAITAGRTRQSAAGRGSRTEQMTVHTTVDQEAERTSGVHEVSPPFRRLHSLPKRHHQLEMSVRNTRLW